MGNVRFCDNEKCMFSGAECPEDKFILELDVDDAPQICIDVLGTQPAPVVKRYVLIDKRSGDKRSFCQSCKNAIDMFHPMRAAH